MSGSATVFHQLNETGSVSRSTDNGHYNSRRLSQTNTTFSGPSSSITSSTHPSPATSSTNSSRQGSQPPTATGAPHSRQHRLSLATLARDKTSSAFANLASRSNPAIPSLHTSSSISNLSEKRTAASTAACGSGAFPSLEVQRSPPRAQDSSARADPLRQSESTQRSGGGGAPIGVDQRPPHHQSQSSSRNPAFSPGHTPQGSFNKMHQTSSRLLRMTDEERPFTRVSILSTPCNSARTRRYMIRSAMPDSILVPIKSSLSPHR